MPILIIYLVKLSISLAVSWLFYQAMLRRLTFYNLNRWYLMGYSLLSFLMPLINIGKLLPEEKVQGTLVLNLPVSPKVGRPELVPNSGFFQGWDAWDICLLVVMVGSVVLMIRLMLRWLSLRRVRRQARLMGDAGVRIFQVDEAILPFSFGNAIFINPKLHTEKEFSTIILHEYVHIRQRHTVDILLSEWLCIVNWFNPFAWLIRYSIRQNLEFIADRKVLENGVDKKGYQYHLLQVLGAPAYRLANNFNFSSLKKRIVMMNKIQTARMHLLKFVFVLPLLVVLLLAFREKIGAAMGSTSSHKKLPLSGSSGENDTQRSRDTVPSGAEAPNADTLKLKYDAKPIFVLNGKEMPKDWQVNSIPAHTVQQAVLQKGPKVVEKYGAKAVNGVIFIYTISAVRQTVQGFRGPSMKSTDSISLIYPDSVHGFLREGSPAMDSSGLPKGNSSVVLMTERMLQPVDLPMVAADEPLFFVDGVLTESLKVDALAPDEIRSITVLKDRQAVALYGVKARNGVILLDTKKFAGESQSVDQVVQGKPMRGENDAPVKPYLYYLDGVQISEEQMRALNPNDLDSLTLLKDLDPNGKYGKRGADGIVLMKSKPKVVRKRQQQVLVVDHGSGDRTILQADTIEWAGAQKGRVGVDTTAIHVKEDPLKNNVYFLNGVKVKDRRQVEPMFARKDILMMEDTDRPEYLKKYGETYGKHLINVVTRDNQNNPNAFITDYLPPKDSGRTP